MVAILVVEDEPLLNLDISDALSAKGYEVIAVTNADDAIKALEFRHDIHTIFTDIDMPGSMDGLKLAAAVRDLAAGEHHRNDRHEATSPQ